MEAQREIRYVHTTLYSVRLADTFWGVSCVVENGKTSTQFLAPTSERREQIKLVKNKSILVLAFED